MNNRKYISIMGPYLYKFEEYKNLSGFKYKTSSNVLHNFDLYYDSLGIDYLSLNRSIVEGYIALKENERITNQCNKASVIRQFGKYLYLNGIDMDIYIIPTISLKGHSEYIPYIFSKEELEGILYYFENIEKIRISPGFIMHYNLANSMIVIITILIYTGMRIGEVLKLKTSSIDLKEQLIYVEEAKNDNKRLVPFGIKVKEEIINYLNKSSVYRNDDDLLFFSINPDNLKHHMIAISNIRYYFRYSLEYNHIPYEKGKGPRLHDFRHTAATMILAKLSRTDDDINASMAYLSTYLGHKSFNETQKYIWLTPELFKDVLKKMENYSMFIKNIFDEEGDRYEDQ